MAVLGGQWLTPRHSPCDQRLQLSGLAHKFLYLLHFFMRGPVLSCCLWTLTRLTAQYWGPRNKRKRIVVVPRLGVLSRSVESVNECFTFICVPHSRIPFFFIFSLSLATGERGMMASAEKRKKKDSSFYILVVSGPWINASCHCHFMAQHLQICEGTVRLRLLFLLTLHHILLATLKKRKGKERYLCGQYMWIWRVKKKESAKRRIVAQSFNDWSLRVPRFSSFSLTFHLHGPYIKKRKNRIWAV